MPHAKDSMSEPEASVRVSRTTLSELERFQSAIHAKSLDEAVRALLHAKRKHLVDEIYGSAIGLRRFRERDRVESDR
jgi:hypothetical protein